MDSISCIFCVPSIDSASECHAKTFAPPDTHALVIALMDFERCNTVLLCNRHWYTILPVYFLESLRDALKMRTLLSWRRSLHITLV